MTAPNQPWKRQFAPRRVILTVITGATLNLLLAESIALFNGGPSWTMTGVDVEMRDRNPALGEGTGKAELYSDHSRFGVTEDWSYIRPAHTNPVPSPTPPRYAFLSPPSRWVRQRVLPAEVGFSPWPTTQTEARFASRVGWPFRCLWHIEHAVNTLPTDWTQMGVRASPIIEGGVEFYTRTTPPVFRRVLPYRPLWLGLIANSAIFVVLLAAMNALPVAFKAAIRRMHPAPGHCPHCAYNRAGLPPTAPCPECGRQ